MKAHGVSFIHIERNKAGKWATVPDSRYNRRITASTPMDLTGPAAGSNLLKTQADPSGTKVLGTFNNCGNGWTPWNPYLACEENFNNSIHRKCACKGKSVSVRVDLGGRRRMNKKIHKSHIGLSSINNTRIK